MILDFFKERQLPSYIAAKRNPSGWYSHFKVFYVDWVFELDGKLFQHCCAFVYFSTGKSGSSGDPVWSEGQVPECQSTLMKIPDDCKLPSFVAVNDPSLPVLSLLRTIFILNRHWGDLYAVGHYKPVISTSVSFLYYSSRYIYPRTIFILRFFCRWLRRPQTLDVNKVVFRCLKSSFDNFKPRFAFQQWNRG